MGSQVFGRGTRCARRALAQRRAAVIRHAACRHTACRVLRVARGVRASSLVSFPAPLPQDLVANCVPHVKKNIGMLTAFQCFWRPLATAETRRDLARKCKRGLAARGIDVAPTLSLLLTSLAVD